MTRVLLTGATGYLGHHVESQIRARGLELVIAGRRAADVPLDLADPASIQGALESVEPDLILNLAAVSSVGICETEPDLAERGNRDAPAVLAGSGLRLLHVSTDLVFGGDRAPYASTATPDPLNVYGRTKAQGEAAVDAGGGLVVRLPLLFGPSFDGCRGATDMIRGEQRVSLYTNEYRTPLHVADAATALVDLLLTDRTGVLHVAGQERVSRWDFGCRFTAVAGIAADHIVPGECDDPTRPRDVSLVSDWDCPRSLDEALRDS